MRFYISFKVIYFGSLLLRNMFEKALCCHSISCGNLILYPLAYPFPAL
jgi:hypothetical protein